MMWRDKKLVLLLKVIHKKKASIIKRLSLRFHQKTLFRTIMALVAHFDLELHQMDVKTAISMVTLMKQSIWCNQKILCREIQRRWFAS